MAYANPSDTAAAMLAFIARDADGQMLASVTQELSARGHGAQNMERLFDLSSFTGSLEITSSEPIVTLSLNFEAAPVFSSLPPGEVDAAAQGSTTYYFPHLAVGASWQTTITYINYSSQEVNCTTEFLSDHGSPLLVSFADRGTVVSRPDTLPPGGSVHQETNVGLSAPLAPGWARATCSGPVKASLLFRQHSSAGVPVAEAGVNAAEVPATRFVTFAEQGEGKSGTGVAYANPSDTSAMLTFTAKDADGETLASVVRTLLPEGHDAENMTLLFGLSNFAGSVEITSTEPIVTLSLNFEAAPVFSSLPSGEVDAADIPGVMFAPANEAAFNDLFVGKRATTSLPTVYADFVSPGRFRETQGADTYTGSYIYQNTGSNTGTVTFNYDDGDRCTTSLTFDSTTSGTATFTCNDGESGEYDWRLVEISAPAGAPDLVVQTSSVSDSNPNAGESFTLSATVRNQGNSLSASTTLRYYRSTDETISSGDTQVGTAAVAALAAAGTGSGVLTLTAPSTAGTHYYGACVDRVSGESNSQNNCSTAVRVTVSASQMESAGFDLASANGNPQGIVFANDRFYVVDWRGKKVYAYQTSGQPDSASHFDLDSANENATGITFANNRFYVVDNVDNKVYTYDAAGQRDSASDFDLAERNATGITFANNKFYSVDYVDHKVYAYDAVGQRDSASDFDLDLANGTPAEITFANATFYVVDRTDLWVYAYDASGQRASAADLYLDSANGAAGGITFANNKFYSVDYADDKVYVLNPTASPDFDLFISFADLHHSFLPSLGDPIEMSVTVANLGPHGSPPARLRFGISIYRDIPALNPPANGIIRGPASRVRVGSVRLGTLIFRACIVEAPGEENTSNNCVSRSVTFR